ncbi:glycerophosphoryl diester phosphodiesterase [Nitrosomonas sp. PY1]|uniref:glycerophosphodiester phosphodiesterase n=1 Tax=Nitrosomonas sp. PY1 TaxID=1803906 RepID=UPI001FC7C07A|nr:glycerophosphodiester phosphodiesterase [Nitrosomonas sp. PY1]GKS70285.1 glycerophosphoryl diester phosphodiesterase [Nitrosomonas sp. PY1]
MNKVLVYAHRGANSEALENTRGAFDKALTYSIDGIETDVQLTRDEIAVLWHDRYLDKIGLNDKHIDDFDYLQLKELMSRALPDENQNPMALEDFLTAYRTRCRLLVEIKNRDWESRSRHQLKMYQTLDMIGKNPDHRIIVSSFNLASLVDAHDYRPDFPLIYNVDDDQSITDVHTINADHPFLHGFCLPIDIIEQEIVDLLRNHHKCIGVYTCNSEIQINKALQLGVDILISDFPQKALVIRDQ